MGRNRPDASVYIMLARSCDIGRDVRFKTPGSQCNSSEISMMFVHCRSDRRNNHMYRHMLRNRFHSGKCCDIDFPLTEHGWGTCAPLPRDFQRTQGAPPLSSLSRRKQSACLPNPKWASSQVSNRIINTRNLVIPKFLMFIGTS